jgi:5-methylcytosine-specific restriction protein A
MSSSGATHAAITRVTAELHTLIALINSETPTADTIAAVESAGRLMDAARVRVAAPLACDPGAAERLGYATSMDAVAAIAQVSRLTARTRLTIAQGVTPEVTLTGAPLPPSHGALAAALDAGRVGIDAAALITRELDAIAPRIERDALAAAETVMVNLAAGLDPAGERVVLPVAVDYLATEVRQIASTVDPDGALPREHRAAHGRSLRLGTQDDDGLIAVHGRLLPEVGVLLRGLVEAMRRSPRFEPADGPEAAEHRASDPDSAAPYSDARTPEQRTHDAFAEILAAAAGADGIPELDGHPVTVIVSVSARDLDAADCRDGDPIGTMAGSLVPVSRAQVERFMDASGFRHVRTSPTGRVMGITSTQRCFTASQRLGIASRDGYRCSTPGCTSPHLALQVHHVVPVRDGGPTTIDNGILLCYYHHRRVDDGPWLYRMQRGLPEVRGPGLPHWSRLRPGVARL